MKKRIFRVRPAREVEEVFSTYLHLFQLHNNGAKMCFAREPQHRILRTFRKKSDCEMGSSVIAVRYGYTNLVLTQQHKSQSKFICRIRCVGCKKLNTSVLEYCLLKILTHLDKWCDEAFSSKDREVVNMSVNNNSHQIEPS